MNTSCNNCNALSNDAISYIWLRIYRLRIYYCVTFTTKSCTRYHKLNPINKYIIKWLKYHGSVENLEIEWKPNTGLVERTAARVSHSFLSSALCHEKAADLWSEEKGDSGARGLARLNWKPLSLCACRRYFWAAKRLASHLINFKILLLVH